MTIHEFFTDSDSVKSSRKLMLWKGIVLIWAKVWIFVGFGLFPEGALEQIGVLWLVVVITIISISTILMLLEPRCCASWLILLGPC